MGFIALERGRVELKEEEVKSIALPTYMMGYQQYNIYSLLEGVLKTVTKAEDDFLSKIGKKEKREHYKDLGSGSFSDEGFDEKCDVIDVEYEVKEGGEEGVNYNPP